MDRRQIQIPFLSIVCLLLAGFHGVAQSAVDQKHLETSLRMIGHQVLLSSGDSTSRVLPIVESDGRYRIEFESEFDFTPEALVATINRVVDDTRIADRYIVEVEECQTGQVVYGYEMDYLEESDIVPCQQRVQPRSCYNILFTLKEKGGATTLWHRAGGIFSPRPAVKLGQLGYLLVFLLFALTFAGFFFLWKRKNRSPANPNLVALGDYRLDRRNAKLLIEEERIDLTGKEADLLLLLHGAVNTTVEREVLLKAVWGDEGDYVGRTLDVFVSKLRKKLLADPKVKIVNIRGVGYKLVVEE